LNFYLFYGDSFKIECPTGSGTLMNLFEVAREISQRLTRIFLRDAGGKRPVYGGAETFQSDPHWRDYVLFYEYFHGDNGAGLGASHQTGWTGLVAKLIQLFGLLDPQRILEAGKAAAFAQAAGAARQVREPAAPAAPAATALPPPSPRRPPPAPPAAPPPARPPRHGRARRRIGAGVCTGGGPAARA